MVSEAILVLRECRADTGEQFISLSFFFFCPLSLLFADMKNQMAGINLVFPGIEMQASHSAQCCVFELLLFYDV